MENWLYIIGSVLILPAIIFALVAQFRVQSAFNKYSAVPAMKGITAAELARQLLSENDCGNVTVERTQGHLSDHYDPRKKVLRLSESVYESTSLAALGIAAHEVGHAVQDKTNYPPLKIRQIVIRSTSLVNKILLPLIIIGIIASLFVTSATIFGFSSADFFFWLIVGLCIIYAISFLVNLITLPTEFNASARAKTMLNESGILADQEEQRGVSSVLSAAAMTYVAALIVSLAYLLRFLGLALALAKNRK